MVSNKFENIVNLFNDNSKSEDNKLEDNSYFSVSSVLYNSFSYLKNNFLPFSTSTKAQDKNDVADASDFPVNKEKDHTINVIQKEVPSNKVKTLNPDDPELQKFIHTKHQLFTEYYLGTYKTGCFTHVMQANNNFLDCQAKQASLGYQSNPDYCIKLELEGLYYNDLCNTVFDFESSYDEFITENLVKSNTLVFNIDERDSTIMCFDKFKNDNNPQKILFDQKKHVNLVMSQNNDQLASITHNSRSTEDSCTNNKVVGCNDDQNNDALHPITIDTTVHVQ